MTRHRELALEYREAFQRPLKPFKLLEGVPERSEDGDAGAKRLAIGCASQAAKSDLKLRDEL